MIVPDVCYPPVFSEALLWFVVSSEDFLDQIVAVLRCQLSMPLIIVNAHDSNVSNSSNDSAAELNLFNKCNNVYILLLLCYILP